MALASLLCRWLCSAQHWFATRERQRSEDWSTLLQLLLALLICNSPPFIRHIPQGSLHNLWHNEHTIASMRSARRLHAHVDALSTNRSQRVAPHMRSSFGKPAPLLAHETLSHKYLLQCATSNITTLALLHFLYQSYLSCAARPTSTCLVNDNSHLLTFCLPYLLTLFLTYLLTFFLTCLLTFFLTYLWTFFLTYLLTRLSDKSSGIVWTFFLAYLLAYLLTFFLTNLLRGWGPARNTALTGSRLRSGAEHCADRIAAEVRRGTPRPHRIAVEVRRGTLRWQDRGRGPARNGALTGSRLRSGTGQEEKEKKEKRWRRTSWHKI